MKNNIKGNIKADSDEFDMSLCKEPKWRVIDKKRWMSQTNSFFFRKCEKPVWTPRGAGLGDGSTEPHVFDDKR